MTVRDPERQMAQVIVILDDYYGRPVWSPRYAPVDELVYTVLSQNTADVNTERTFASLTARFPTWSAVRDAPVEAVEEAIQLGGLAKTKAPRIKTILAAISGLDEEGAEEEDAAVEGQRMLVSPPPALGEPDLSILDRLDDEAAQDYLSGLPGVGPKTAACVLMFALGRPVMPVDTHVHRVARRLGLIDRKVTAEQAHPILTELAGLENVYAAHVNLVRHGRQICHARRPECGRCPLASICPSAFLV
jgi:endonuclease III